MTTHSETRRLPYTPDQMYELVADVPSYPKFLPWVAAARERRRFAQGEAEVIEADLIISFKVFREKFGSRVTLWPKQRIETEYIDGPFSHMRSIWDFAAPDGGAGVDVNFFVDFEFRNKVLDAAAGVFFNDAMQRIVRAFERRAAELYT